MRKPKQPRKPLEPSKPDEPFKKINALPLELYDSDVDGISLSQLISTRFNDYDLNSIYFNLHNRSKYYYDDESEATLEVCFKDVVIDNPLYKEQMDRYTKLLDTYNNKMVKYQAKLEKWEPLNKVYESELKKWELCQAERKYKKLKSEVG